MINEIKACNNESLILLQFHSLMFYLEMQEMAMSWHVTSAFTASMPTFTSKRTCLHEDNIVERHTNEQTATFHVWILEMFDSMSFAQLKFDLALK